MGRVGEWRERVASGKPLAIRCPVDLLRERERASVSRRGEAASEWVDKSRGARRSRSVAGASETHVTLAERRTETSERSKRRVGASPSFAIPDGHVLVTEQAARRIFGVRALGIVCRSQLAQFWRQANERSSTGSLFTLSPSRIGETTANAAWRWTGRRSGGPTRRSQPGSDREAQQGECTQGAAGECGHGR